MEIPLKEMENDEIYLKFRFFLDEDKKKGYVPSYHFYIVQIMGNENVGTIDLRVGHNENTYYGGNVGYTVYRTFRGKGYAAQAVKLLIPFAKKLNMRQIFITMNPDNIASIRSCENAGGKYLEEVDLPEYNEMYREGERKKLIYTLDIE